MLTQRKQTIIGIIIGSVFGTSAVMGMSLLDHIRSGGILREMCGLAYYIAVVVLLLSVLVRVVCSIFSVRIRSLAEEHPTIHAVWYAAGFGVLLGIVIVALFFQAKSR